MVLHLETLCGLLMFAVLLYCWKQEYGSLHWMIARILCECEPLSPNNGTAVDVSSDDILAQRQ